MTTNTTKYEIVRDGIERIRFGIYNTLAEARKNLPNSDWVIREVK